jgi:membrane associated rhomboid family serine protease
MKFIKFYLILLIITSTLSVVDYLFLNESIISLVGVLGIITVIIGVIAVFKIRKLNLSKSVKLFPVFVLLSVFIIILLTSIFGINSVELVKNGVSVQESVIETPKWILILDKIFSGMFIIWATKILQKIKINY